MSIAHFTRDQLLAPHSWDAFLDRYWEKEYLYISGRPPHHYDKLFLKRDIDALIPLASGEQGVRLARNGEKSVVANDAAAMYNAYRNGYTIVINRLHRFWRSVNLCCLHLEELISHPTGVNLYLTPPGSTGFSPHFDTHDVFVLQISGHKKWELYGNYGHLPGRDQKVALSEVGPPQHCLELNPGDLLYMPRGLVHGARTASESSSLHLTLGVHPVCWGDLLARALDEARHDQVELRESLPPGFLQMPPEQLGAHMQSLLAQVMKAARPEEAVSALASQLFSRRPQPMDDHFAMLDAVQDIGPDTLLAKRPGTHYQIVEEGQQVVLVFTGGAVRMPSRIRGALEFVSQQQWFSLASIPQLDDSGRLTLVRKLVQEGFLTLLD